MDVGGAGMESMAESGQACMLYLNTFSYSYKIYQIQLTQQSNKIFKASQGRDAWQKEREGIKGNKIKSGGNVRFKGSKMKKNR